MGAKTDTAKRGIDGRGLKIIALITMFVDHAAATILERIIFQKPAWGPVTDANIDMYYNIYMFLRGVGRMAFPIYCFLLVEGFVHTRSRLKYAIRLFLFALVSEVPFDLAFQKSFFDMSYNNVFFTLLIGFVILSALEWIKGHVRAKEEAGSRRLIMDICRILLIAVVVFAGCAAAEILHTDYSASGVIAICILYEFRDQRMMGFALAVIALALLAGSSEIVALFMLIPMHFYNGARGRQSKYFFYAFYPVHLLLLSLVCFAMGLGI